MPQLRFPDLSTAGSGTRRTVLLFLSIALWLVSARTGGRWFPRSISSPRRARDAVPDARSCVWAERRSAPCRGFRRDRCWCRCSPERRFRRSTRRSSINRLGCCCAPSRSSAGRSAAASPGRSSVTRPRRRRASCFPLWPSSRCAPRSPFRSVERRESIRSPPTSLATSPGGVDSVAVIASGATVDLPVVMALQTARFLLILLFGPLIARRPARLAARLGTQPHFHS